MSRRRDSLARRLDELPEAATNPPLHEVRGEGQAEGAPGTSVTRTYREAIRSTLASALQSRPEVLLLGQGIDDHLGCFGSTLGLAEQFGRERVMDVPIAEEGVTGIAIGAALAGMRPVLTHIRNDFALLATNQLVNLAAKMRYTYGGRLEVPLLVRAIIGRSWGQGPQHSQSLQATFAHFPGLVVLVPATADDVERGYRWALERHRGPVISFEHRLLYDVEFRCDDGAEGAGSTPVGQPGRDSVDPLDSDSPPSTRVVREGRHVTVVATSIQVLEALRAADHLAESGIEVEVLDLACASHPGAATIVASVRKTGNLLVADTGWSGYGVAAEIARLVCERDPGALRRPMVSLGMAPSPCPTAKVLEDLFYPSFRELVNALARLAVGRDDHGVPLPEVASTTEIYRRFRGPF